MWKGKTLITIIVTLVLAGCTKYIAPAGTVPHRNKIDTDAFGAWAELSFDSVHYMVNGEFIATCNDSVYIMLYQKVYGYPDTSIKSAKLILFNKSTNGYIVWTVLGSIATLSNGGYFLFTMPAMLTSGLIAITAENKIINHFDYPEYSWDELSKYARFPQGLPIGIDRNDITSGSKKNKQN